MDTGLPGSDTNRATGYEEAVHAGGPESRLSTTYGTTASGWAHKFSPMVMWQDWGDSLESGEGSKHVHN
jgi:hypothetical protein